jgi:Uncharacterized protein conserved in bacteria (DUF2252)
MCWGVDDFDEAWPLPYTNDLTRLAASVKIARKLAILSIRTKHACEIILKMYERTLREGGCPIVLARGGCAVSSGNEIELLRTLRKNTPRGWKRSHRFNEQLIPMFLVASLDQRSVIAVYVWRSASGGQSHPAVGHFCRDGILAAGLEKSFCRNGDG